MNNKPIRVIVADDHGVVREGIRTVLEASDDFDVIAEAATGEEALRLIAEHDPDVAILDITMPELSGIEVITRLRERAARTSVLILSMHDHPEYVLGAVRAGADGYLMKSAGPAEVRDAVRAVADGRESFSSRVTQQLSSALRDEAARETSRDRLEQLTPREKEVLVRVAEGRTSREIAEEFGISPRTVETHRESIMRKLGIRTVAGLTRFALEAGITS
ncbi:MAG TPA: response regulator transcription factor [Longimicrobiales bacterium]|nr:response regulator transcription factor [Longimicrobiales bacterium]